MNNIFETIIVVLTLIGAGSFFIWWFGAMLYMVFIEDKLRTGREAKARKLYPNYYFWADKRDEHLNLKHGYFRGAYRIKENIDKILAEKPYLPNNMLVPTEELLDGLRNDYQELKRKEEAEDVIVNQLTEKMKAIWADNKLLMKLYSFN